MNANRGRAFSGHCEYERVFCYSFFLAFNIRHIVRFRPSFQMKAKRKNYLNCSLCCNLKTKCNKHSNKNPKLSH